jgi:integrase
MLYEDPSVKEFFSNRNLAPSTVTRYLEVLRLYVLYTGLTPKELIDEAEKEEDNRIRMRYRKIKTRLIGFKEFLISKNYSDGNIQNNLTTVKTFYHEFEIETGKMKTTRNYHESETIKSIPTKDHIRCALSFANLKYQSIILLMLSSGCGASEIISLSYEDLLRSLKQYIELPKTDLLNVDVLNDMVHQKEKQNTLIVATWHVIRTKTKMPYVTFSTSESIKAILKYLHYNPPESLDDPLFRVENVNRKLTVKALTTYFYRLNTKCEFGKTGRLIFLHSHVYRKYFASTLYKNKLPELNVHWMLGHKIDKVTEAYFKSDINALREQYISCIPDLSIEDTEVRVLESEDKKLLKELQRKVDLLEEADRLRKGREQKLKDLPLLK